MNKIIELVKGLAQDAIMKNADIADDKKNVAIDTAATALGSELSNNVSGLAGLLSGGGSLANTLKSSVASALTEKAGLSPAISSTIASTIVSMLVSKLSGGSKSDGFNVESLMDMLGGGKSDGKKGGLLGSLGDIFK